MSANTRNPFNVDPALPVRTEGKISASLLAWANGITGAYEILNDGDGYWLYLSSDYVFPAAECGSAHEETIGELKAFVKSSPPMLRSEWEESERQRYANQK